MANYAGFWVRVAAYILDTIISGIAMVIVGMAIALGAAISNGGISSIALESSGFEAFVNVVSIVLGWLYFAIFESSKLQGTLGKKAVGIIVTDESGHRISFLRATGRYFAKIISAVILLIGYFMIGWTTRKQGLHDMIAGTLVYHAKSSDELIGHADVFS